MLMTTSAAWTASSVSAFGNSLDRSIPTSSMAARTAGLISSAGAEPAERTCTRPGAWWSSSAAAICERPALCTQINSTSGMSDTVTPWSGGRRLRRHGGGCDRLGRRGERGRDDPVVDPGAAAVARDQPGLAQDLEVVGDRRAGHVEAGGQLADARLAAFGAG